MARAEDAGSRRVARSRSTWRAGHASRGARLRAARDGEAHRPRLRGPRDPATPRHARLIGRAGAAARAGAQPGRQRAAVHACRRHRHGAHRAPTPSARCVVLQVEDTGPGIPAGRARAGLPALLPRAGHRGRRQRAWAWPSCARSRSATAPRSRWPTRVRAAATTAAARRAVHGALRAAGGRRAGRPPAAAARARPAGAGQR
ncbi:MAG: hypothetical protein MZW92_14070 [Comamonadaceae bacterium]|nr:hypothetical protein [Comamonadaceae bacterium]